jgi:hypothetical protein
MQNLLEGENTMTKTHAFHLTGAARKPLIEAIEGFAKAKGVYQGAPKFGYAFSGLGSLDKEGALHFDCGAQAIMDCLAWLEQRGFTCGADGEPAGEEAAPIGSETDRICIEFPREGMSDAAIENLRRMVAAKAPLIKMAIGASAPSGRVGVAGLPIEVLEDRICFDWFETANDNGQIDCWAQFIARLCFTASGKTRVTAQEREFVNPRYQMRCFCLALGMIGPEYAATRKLLCSGLPGNSGWLTPPEKKIPEADPALEETPVDEPAAEDAEEPAV